MKKKLIKIIAYIYRFTLLPAASVVGNIIVFVKNITHINFGYCLMRANKRRVKSLDAYRDFIQGCYGYAKDSFFGFLNYIPLTLSFHINDGGDCSVWARITYRYLNSMYKAGTIPNKPRMYLIIDGFNIMTAHVVTMIKLLDNTVIMFNVSTEVIGSSYEELLNMFKNDYLVSLNGKDYRFKDPVFIDWF